MKCPNFLCYHHECCYGDIKNCKELKTFNRLERAFKKGRWAEGKLYLLWAKEKSNK